MKTYAQSSMCPAWTNIRADYFHNEWGMGEQFQRQLWHPHWERVEAEDLEMGIGPWASRRRKQIWLARFGVEIAKCNTRMISRSQHIVD